MEFRQAIQELIYYSDRIKDLDREIVRIEEGCKGLLQDSIENGLIYFDQANTIHSDLIKAQRMRQEITDAEGKVDQAKVFLQDNLRPFDGYRVVYEYRSDGGPSKTFQVFMEDDQVKFV